MKIKRVLFTLMILILTITCVEAKEVNAIYEYVSDNSVYSKKITSKDTNIKLDDFNVIVVDAKEKYKNVDIKIIAVTDDIQLEKLKSQIKNNNIEKAYYLIFEDTSKNQINVNDLKIKLNTNNYIIYTVNSNGNIIDKSNSNNQEIEISNNNYFVIAIDNSIKKIEYKANSGGVIVLDGQIITEAGKYTFKSDKIVIRNDSGYELNKAALNGKNILDQIYNGFLDVSQENDINLELEFSEINESISDEKYRFSGRIVYNDKPLANAYVELHSDVMTTITDQNGNFYFDNVSLGKHSITISHDDNVIGYSEFLINNNENNEIEVTYKTNEKVLANSSDVNLILYINKDYDIKITNKGDIINKSDINQDNNQNNKYLFIILILLIILLIIVYYIVKKVKKSNQ